MAIRPINRIASAATPSGTVFGVLYGVENFGRAMLATTISLYGIEVMETVQSLSIVLFATSIISLIVTLGSGVFIQIISRKFVFSIACCLSLISMVFFLIETPTGFILANTFRACAAGLILICISLYVLDFIPKKELAKAESRRIFFGGFAWLMAPGIGTWTWANIDHSIPFLISFLTTVILLGLFWWLRIKESHEIDPPNSKNLNILTNVFNYFNNGHMRVAYIIAVCRSSAWVVFFAYGPIYMLDAGVAPEWIGFIISAIMSALMLSAQFLKFARFVGIRRIIVYCFILAGIFFATIGLLPKPTIWGLGLFFMASLCIDMLDVIGNLPFLRTVPKNTRVEMTTVFSTWRELSFTLTPGIAYIVLIFLPVHGLFLVLGCAFLATGAVASTIPVRIDK